MRQERDYASCARALGEKIAAVSSRDERMRLTVEVLWAHLQDKRVAWLGFYELAPGGDSMLLRVCRPKPACSPIGLHGVCGKSLKERAPQIVGDVHALGADHIVCDPSNLSEVVVPCLAEDGTCWGVLDLDSQELSAFSDGDAEGLRAVLLAAGLTV